MALQDIGVRAYENKGQRRPQFKNAESGESPSLNARAAQALAKRGFRVFPIVPLGKTPLTPNGFKNATADPATIMGLWARHPDANIGVAVGDFVVLDIDGEEGLKSFEKITGHSDPLKLFPLVQQTPNGGFHVWFERNGIRIRNRAGDVGPGLDTRGVTREGEPAGYVLVSPSTIRRKDRAGLGRYEWLDPTALERLGDVPEMPRDLAYLCTFNKHEREVIAADPALRAKIEAATPQKWLVVFDAHRPQLTTTSGEGSQVPYRHPYIQAILQRECEEIAAAAPGCQETTFNDACFRIGARLKSYGLDVHAEDAIARLVEASQSMVNERGREPWTLSELREKARRAVVDGLERGTFAAKDLSGSRAAEPDHSFVPSDDRTAAEYGASINDWNDAAIKELLNRMNLEHALVSLGSSTRYLHERPGRNGKSDMFFLRPEDMKRLYANVRFKVDGRWMNGFDQWDKWPGRRQYRGVGMFPGNATVPAGYLNLWRGFAIEPQRGDWSLLKSHLRDMVCGGDERLFNWLMDWLAHLVQRPEEKPGTAIVLKSPGKGTGKTLVLGYLMRIFGVHAMSAANSEHVAGRFNGHMLRLLLLGVEEAFWAGSKSAEGIIKSLITETYLTVEQKGIDAINVENFTRLFIISNEDWVVPVGMDERRFLVLEVRNPHAKKRSYFKPIFDQMDKDGGLAAMLHELLARDITNSDVRNPPETKGLQEQREHSLGGVHKWLLEVARSGAIQVTAAAQNQHNWPDPEIEINFGCETEIPCGIVRDAARAYCDRYEVQSVDTRLGLLLTKLGVVRKQPMTNGKRQYVYVIPPLPVLQEKAQELLNIPIEGSEHADKVREANGGSWPPPVIGRGWRQDVETQSTPSKGGA